MLRTKTTALLYFTASSALLALSGTAHAQPAFEITVKNVVPSQEGTKIEDEKPEQVITNKKVVVETRKKRQAAVKPAPQIEGVDAITTGSVTAQGSPETEQLIKINRIVTTTEERQQIDIRTVFDVFDADPVLNVKPVLANEKVLKGEPYVVRGIWNYSAFIDRAEIRVFEKGQAFDAQPAKTIELDEYREAIIHTDGDLSDNFSYVLRVYDENGRFDETKPRYARVVDVSSNSVNDPDVEDPILVLEDADDFTAKRLIKVEGGSVIIRGANIYSDEAVSVMGTKIRVSENNEFEAQEILPYGTHDIPIDIEGPRSKLIERTMVIPNSEWFYVGQLDLTVGNGISDRRQEYSNDLDVIGRAGLYLKGKMKGGYTVTASVDTEEDELKYLFSNINERHQDSLLNRVNPELLFPVYGDSSSIVDDAPSQTNLYARIDRGDDHIVIGSYSINSPETSLIELDRGLFGTKALYKSDELTSRGDIRSQVLLYGASLDTVANYELLVGTGGTFYRLSRQDIIEGSVRLQIEIRNRTTNTVTEVISLQEGRDYSVDHLTGRLILAKPLAGTLQSSNATVGTDDLAVISARYEYEPTVTDIDGYTVAGRATHYLNDNVRIGVTGKSEVTDLDRNNSAGADIYLRHGDHSWLRAEYARSNGPARTLNSSVDGGTSFNAYSTTQSSIEADAFKFDALLDISEFMGYQDDVKREIGGYFEHYDQGFSGSVLLNSNETQNWGLFVRLIDEEDFKFTAQYDETRIQDQGQKRLISGKISKKVDVTHTASLGVTHDWVARGSSFSTLGLPAQANRFGSRTDVIARIDREIAKDQNVYVFGQVTANRDGTRRRNDRVGVGANIAIDERSSIGGEVSYGTSGINAGLEYTQSKEDDTEVSIGYAFVDDTRFQPEIGGIGSSNNHALKFRGTRKLSDTTSVFTETTTGLGNSFDLQDSTNAFGLEYSPNDQWRYTGLIDAGVVDYSADDALRRISASISADYTDDALSFSAALETRFDRGFQRDADFYGARVGATYKYNDDWTLLASGEGTYSNGENTSFFDSEFMKATLAGAYRPVDNDRFNALFKYEYVSDLSPFSQVGVNDFNQQPKQRSHIGNFDFTYDVSDTVTLGAKYAIRQGEVSLSRDSDQFESSLAQLGVLRADLKFNDDWALMIEGRVLEVADLDYELGAVAGLWYNVNDNLKVGAGYSMSRFSTELSDLSKDHEGFFFNVGAAF
jgi:hypothetical protein